MASPPRLVLDVRSRRRRRIAASLLMLLPIATAAGLVLTGLRDLWTVVNLFVQLRATREAAPL